MAQIYEKSLKRLYSVYRNIHRQVHLYTYVYTTAPKLRFRMILIKNRTYRFRIVEKSGKLYAYVECTVYHGYVLPV